MRDRSKFGFVLVSTTAEDWVLKADVLIGVVAVDDSLPKASAFRKVLRDGGAVNLVNVDVDADDDDDDGGC